jgi:hypothetical protein
MPLAAHKNHVPERGILPSDEGDFMLESHYSTRDAQELLSEYRTIAWRKTILESMPGTGRKSLEACEEQMRLTWEFARWLRKRKPLGEKMYWIIFAT